MPDEIDMDLCEGWLTRPLEPGELMFLKGVKANDPPSDGYCVICLERYGTPKEDGATPEYAVHFPCGHAVGNACLYSWLDRESPNLDCIFCKKTMIPARYLQEQVKEIWEIVHKMSTRGVHEELSKKKTRGPLSRAVEPLWRYVGEAPSLKGFRHYNEGLMPTFEWLLVATREFLAALEKSAELSRSTNRHEINFEAVKRRKYEFDRNYDSFQRVVMEMSTVEKSKEAAEREEAMKNAAEGEAVRTVP